MKWLLLLIVFVSSCTTPSDPVADRRDEIPNPDVVVGNVYKKGDIK